MDWGGVLFMSLKIVQYELRIKTLKKSNTYLSLVRSVSNIKLSLNVNILSNSNRVNLVISITLQGISFPVYASLGE